MRRTPATILALPLVAAAVFPTAAVAKTVTVGKKSSGHTLHIGRGDTLRVRLVDLPSSGYGWSVTTKPSRAVLAKQKSKIVSDNGKKQGGGVVVGAPATHFFIWKGKELGTTTIGLKEFGPGSKNASAAVRYTVVVR